MPLPAIPIIISIIATALTVYEALDVLGEIYEGLDKYNQGVDEAKKQLEEMIQKLKEEIDQKIDEKEQVPILLAAAGKDPQSETTKRGSGWGMDNGIISAAIRQKIPFRQVISDVCEKADNLPVLQLRKKKGVTIKDLPKAKRKALEEILRIGVENIADVDLDKFILVRLKQFTASLMFEFVDYALDWASPLKAEVTFGPAKKYTDHPCEGTRLKRIGKTSPFYPFPPPNNRKGSIAADLIINEYRKKPTGKANIFAIVEIKFAGDKIDGKQFDKYHDLLGEAASEKTKKSPVRFDKRSVSEGGRLSLFRYPLDKPVEEGKDKKKPQSEKKKKK